MVSSGLATPTARGEHQALHMPVSRALRGVLGALLAIERRLCVRQGLVDNRAKRFTVFCAVCIVLIRGRASTVVVLRAAPTWPPARTSSAAPSGRPRTAESHLEVGRIDEVVADRLRPHPRLAESASFDVHLETDAQ